MIYFDYAATTLMSEEAITAFTEAARHCFGNESSLHNEGSKAKQLLEASRQIIASSLDTNSENIIFTSGGTESNHLSILTLLKNADTTKNHIICSSLEHHSIHQQLSYLKEQGYEIDYMKHHPNGLVHLEHLKQQIKDTTALIILQHVNSEIGVVQPIEAVYDIIHPHHIMLHIDCVQSFGKLDCKPICKCADSLSLSSHKVYGPKGVGAIVFPRIDQLQPYQKGITHEGGYRAGTVNVPSIYSFASALHSIKPNDQVIKERAIILDIIKKSDAPIECIEAPPEAQLPHIICLVFSNVQGQYVMMELNKKGYYVSSGSACQSGTKAPSKTLLALGKNEDEAKSSIRISLGIHPTEEHCRNLAQEIIHIIKAI